MEASGRNRGRPPGNRLDRKPSRFFQIILPHMVDQNHLRIPKRFVEMRLNWQLPTVGKLRVPKGLCMKVTIDRKDDNRVYFTQGWKQFLERNSIQSCYFLEFEYKGHRNFSVHIFDLSCCEVPYSMSRAKISPAENDQDDDDDHLPKNNPVRKVSMIIQRPVQKESAAKEHPGRVKLEELDEEVADRAAGRPSFTVAIQKYNLVGNYMHVPTDFAKKNLLSSIGKVIKLQLDDGREWNLRCSKSKGSKAARLVGNGWTKFIRETKMKRGDICTFELVDEEYEGLKDESIKTKIGLV